MASTVQVLIEVTDEAGVVTPEVVDLDLDLTKFSLQESVVLEELLGEERFAALMEGNLNLFTPSTVRALLYAKLKLHHRDLTVDSFDLDYDSLSAALR